VLLALSVLAGVLWWLRRRDIRFVIYEAVPWPNAPWLSASLLLFGLALILSVPPVWRAVLAAVGCGGVGLGLAWLLASGAIGLGRGDEVDSYSAPQAPYRLVVHRNDFFDPVYFLSIEQQTGPASRSWYLGCMGGDYDRLEKAGWIQPDLFSIVSSGEDPVIEIRVDPTSGQPVDPEPIPDGCGYRP
jgi:hypothetical protein